LDIPRDEIGNNPGPQIVNTLWRTVQCPMKMTLVATNEGRPVSDPERPSFAHFARQHLDRLYAFCVKLCDGPQDAEDVVQETLIRAMRGYANLREPARGRSWLFSIATNIWRDTLRARGRQVDTLPLDQLGGEDDDFSLYNTIAIEDPFPYSDEVHLDFLRLFRDEDFRSVFANMNPAFRLPIILTVIHGFSCKEAAAVLDIPLGTLLSRLHRARKQLERGLWEHALAKGLITSAEDDR
jgi:RNA polymerase sigma-70 factor, ECF subfamily